MSYSTLIPKVLLEQKPKSKDPVYNISRLSFDYPYVPEGLEPKIPDQPQPSSNDYYNEIVQQYPAISRKIRKFAPIDPYKIYNEQNRFKKSSQPPSYDTNYESTPIEDIFDFEEQHLPTSLSNEDQYRRQVNYNNLLETSGNTLIKPVSVENYQPTSCSEVYGHCQSCSFCSKAIFTELFLHRVLIIILLFIIIMLIALKK